MKTFSKIFVVLALVLCMSLVFVACAEDPAEAPGTDAPGTSDTTADTSDTSDTQPQGGTQGGGTQGGGTQGGGTQGGGTQGGGTQTPDVGLNSGDVAPGGEGMSGLEDFN